MRVGADMWTSGPHVFVRAPTGEIFEHEAPGGWQPTHPDLEVVDVTACGRSRSGRCALYEDGRLDAGDVLGDARFVCAPR
jgi:hypothetical protein